MDRDDETRLATALAYARMLKRDFEVTIRGVELNVRPYSSMKSLKDTWQYLAIKKARRAYGMEDA